MTDAPDLDAGLPRIPLPTLERSCELFLDWCRPLLDADEWARTEQAVAAFRAPDSPAHRLHAALTEYDGRPGVDSWLDDFWRRRYLGRRDRIALNANFFFVFTDTGESQVQRAVTLVERALAFHRAIDQDTLPPPTLRGTRLTRAQYPALFSGTRIPGVEIDTFRGPYTHGWPGPSDARHILVFRRGGMSRVDVLDETGRPYSPAALADALTGLLDAEPGPGVGHLTTLARADWAAARAALRDAGNADALDTVERALFCVSLEHEEAPDVATVGDVLLAGDSANRWFDKAVTLVVLPDGRAGLNGEHCELDGTTMIALVDAVVGADGPEPAEPVEGTVAVVPVHFTLDDALRERVAAAGRDFAAYAAATVTTALDFPDLGSDAMKARRVSPDGLVQMAAQLAHVRARGRIGATYESIAMRTFRHGRTEAMRVVTPESAAFVADPSEPALRAAIEAHAARAKACQAGDAPEQHLWALQMIQQGLIVRDDGVADGPLALYDSPGWQVLRADYLSTSSVPSVNVHLFGFGSTSDTCIGVGYVLLPDRLHVFLSSPAALAEEQHAFADALRAALPELLALLDG